MPAGNLTYGIDSSCVDRAQRVIDRQSTEIMSPPKVRIAVAGAGQIGRRHIELIGRSAECELSAIVDPAPAAADHARMLGVPLYASLADLLAKNRPDGVILATPNQLHVGQALECIAAGIPTLVEKPLAHTLEAGVRLCAAAEAADVPVLVGHHRRHSSIMAKAVEVIESGMLGKIVAVTGTVLFYKAESEGYFDGAFSWRREPGGGPILLNMIHEVGNLRSLCGEIIAVQAFTSNATRKFPVEDTVAIALRFANGALGTFMLSDTVASDRSWEHTSGEDPRYAKAHTDDDDCYVVAGTFGSLAIPTMRVQRYLKVDDRSWHKALEKSVIEREVADPLERQIAHFGDVIRGRAKPLVSAHDGLQNLRVVEAIVEAAKSGRVVRTV
jgi:predicted dehydrogenase